MRVLSALIILYSYYGCKCANSDGEDGGKSRPKRKSKEIKDRYLQEHMNNLNLGARPKQRTPLTNQFPIDYIAMKHEIEAESGGKSVEKWVEDQGKKAKEEIRRLRELEEQERTRLREERRRREEDEKLKHREGHHKDAHKEQQPIGYGYPPYDPNTKHFHPGPIYPPPDPELLNKPPAALSAESYVRKPSSPIQEYGPDIPPPPTRFPRPCTCGTASHNRHSQDGDQSSQGAAAGGAPQQRAAQPQSQRGRSEGGAFEHHRNFPPFGQGNLPPLAAGVVPPPPPPPPFQQIPRRTRDFYRSMYRDITERLTEITLDTKDKINARKSTFLQVYGNNGTICHIFQPVQGCIYTHVMHRGETIWRTTSKRRCIRVELCNIGHRNKVATLNFNTGDSSKFRKTKNKWYIV